MIIRKSSLVTLNNGERLQKWQEPGIKALFNELEYIGYDTSSLAAISIVHINKAISSWQNRKLKPSTIHKYLTCIRSVASSWGIEILGHETEDFNRQRIKQSSLKDYKTVSRARSGRTKTFDQCQNDEIKITILFKTR